MVSVGLVVSSYNLNVWRDARRNGFSLSRIYVTRQGGDFSMFSDGTIFRRTLTAVAASVLFAAVPPVANAQLATLDKGHQLLVNNGLQIWGVATDTSYGLNYASLENANMNGVMWGFPAVGGTDMNALGPGDKWGKWTDWQYNSNPANGPIVTPQTALTAAENARKSDLIALQVGDEINQSDMENGTKTRDWLLAAGNGTATTADDVFPNTLLYVNSFFIGNHGNYANFLATANPDAISWDSYPFANPHGHYILPKNWLTLGNIFRRHGLGSYIGATNSSPRPYGMFVQTYHDSFAVDPGEVEIRWQQFAAWTMGYKFVDAFIFSGGNNNFGNNPSGPVYQAFQETARQGQNLGPALTKLISYGYGPSFVQGAGSTGIPGDWLAFDRNNAQPSQRYLTGISNVTNLGTKNGGLSGDVYVGFFNPLHLSFGDPAGTTYFMVMNGLGGDLTLPNGQSDNTATVAETRQQMTLNFDFGVTGINSLERLNRNTGLVEVISTSFNDGGNTVFTSLGNGKYQLQLRLDGGTGDLFKYNDGSPFVGVQAATPVAYWDGDANSANNDIASGAGMGGNGDWGVAARWSNGTTNSTYTPGSNVVFGGTAGAVTLGAPQSVASLQFKTNGYVVSGSSITLAAPTIMVDADVTATISSQLSGSNGLIKNGPGTLNLQSANNYNGNTTINEGVLSINNVSLGALPGAPTPNVQINHGATLRFTTALTLPANRQIVLGSGGGVIETSSGSSTIQGVISGAALTKAGAGTLTLTASNSHSGTVVTGGLLHVSHDGALGAMPGAFTAGNLTLDGGTLRFGDNFQINNNRGITLGPNGGTIDTQNLNNGVNGYNAFQGGFRGDGDLTKLGTGTFFASATTGGANVSWKGRLILKEGTWKIVASDGLPYNVSLADGLKADQVTLDGGTWQMGATINVTNARRGITVASGGGTIDTQAFNLTWAGPIAGNNSNAVLTKVGSGTLTFTGVGGVPSSYSGTVNLTAGILRLNNANSMGPMAAIQLSDTPGAALHLAGSVSIGSISGGGATGGNVASVSPIAIQIMAGGNNNSTTFSGVISGHSASLTKTGSGTMTLNGANTYTGGTTVAGGTLAVNGAIAGNASVQNGATLAGSGIVGGTTTLQSGGTLAPGSSAGTISLGELTMQSGSSLEIEIGSTSDLVQVTGTAMLSGALKVSLLEDASPQLGQLYTIVTAGTRNCTFDGDLLPTFSNLTFDVIYNPQSVQLKVVPMLQGDFNADGKVDAADYVVWRKGGAAFTPADYDDWRENFGAVLIVGEGSDHHSRVPEPVGGILVFISIFMTTGARCAFATHRKRNLHGLNPRNS
jgi:autotransporter-associated beta strand protein